MFTYVLLAIVGLVVLLFLLAGVKIVRPYERGIVERLGKYKETNLNSTSISKRLVKRSVFFNKQVLSFLMLSGQGNYGVSFLSNNYALQQGHFRF